MWKIDIVVALALVAMETANGQEDATSREWNKPIPPFRIAGNLYYVGAIEISSYLITTPQGHFLLDGGFVETEKDFRQKLDRQKEQAAASP